MPKKTVSFIAYQLGTDEVVGVKNAEIERARARAGTSLAR